MKKISSAQLTEKVVFRIEPAGKRLLADGAARWNCDISTYVRALVWKAPPPPARQRLSSVEDLVLQKILWELGQLRYRVDQVIANLENGQRGAVHADLLSLAELAASFFALRQALLSALSRDHKG
jgi:hypothetical protein